MYKAVLTDFDETLVGADLQVSEPVKNAIREAQKRAYIGLVTGRPLSVNVARVIQDIPLTGLQVINGGTTIVDAQSKSIEWRAVLEPSVVEAIIVFVQRRRLDMFIDEDLSSYTNIDDPSKLFSKGANYGSLDTLPNQQVTKIVLRTYDCHRLRNEVYEALCEQFPNLKIIKWFMNLSGRGGIDIAAATKRDGVEQYLGLLNIKPEELIVIGDGENDIPLFELNCFKVAIGNAVDELKAIADVVAPSVHENGVAWVLQKYLG